MGPWELVQPARRLEGMPVYFQRNPMYNQSVRLIKKGDNIEVMVEASPSVQLCPIFVIVVQNEGYIV